MSGIVGVFHSDGRPVSEAILRKMLDAISHRGPDGSGIWSTQTIGLGHNSLRTQTERPTARLPLVADGLTITADARLDNREELIASLRLTARDVSDAELIAAAYRRWGDESPQRLLGDFAFAIWDGERRQLFCARDHVGVRPFYYHADDRRFVFASEIKGLLALPDMPREIDDERIVDFLVGLPAEAARTLHAGILRLPPRHSLTVSAAGVSLREYWRPRLSSVAAADAADRFRETFTEAVRCRLADAASAGAMLSGGLDSSSIACVAGPIFAAEHARPLPTLSLVFDRTPAWSERKAIEAVLAGGGFEPHFEDGGDCAPFASIGQILAEQDGLFAAPGLPFGRHLYAAGAARGLRVLLDGHGGDEVVSHGAGRTQELAQAGRWLALGREVRGLARLHGGPWWPTYVAYLDRYARGRLGAAWRRATGERRRRARHPASRWADFVNPEMAARTAIAERREALRSAEARIEAEEGGRHASAILSSRVAQSFEVLDKAAAAAGVEPRYPFWDKRLVELCLSLPDEQKLDGGWSRLVLRRAMEGILPASIQWRPDKLEFAPHIVRGMLGGDRARIEHALLADADAVGQYVSLPAVRDAYQRIADRKEAAHGRDIQAVWRAVVLSAWLKERSVSEPASTS